MLVKSILSPFNSGLGFKKMTNVQMQEAIRFENYRLFYRFYAGDQRDHGRTDGEELITANLCEAFVDKNAAFLAGKSFLITDNDGEFDNDAVQYARDMWDRSNKDLTFYENSHNSSLFGDFAYYVMEDSTGYPKVYAIPCVFVWPFWHPDDKSILVSAKIEYPVDNADGSSSVITLLLDSQKVSKYKDGALQDYKLHLLGEPPLVFAKNKHMIGSDLGKSDIQSILDLQRQFNSKLTDMSDIMAYHASPITIGYGVRLDALERSASKMISGLPFESKVENLEARGDMAGAIAHLRDMKRLIHQLGAVPEISFGTVDELKFSNSSGLALQLLYQPMLDTLKIKHIYHGKALRDVNRLLIKWGVRRMELRAPKDKKELVKFFNTGVAFPDPLPRDEMLQLNTIIAKLDKRLILPSRALQELGETNITEYFKKLKEEWALLVNAGYPDPSANQISNLGANITSDMVVESKDDSESSDDSKPSDDSSD
jgi:hypothetical protein